MQIQQGQTVLGSPEYQTAESGEFELLDLVPCKLITDQSWTPTCAFLCKTVLGLDD